MPISGALIGPAISGAGSLFGGMAGKGASQSAANSQLKAAQLAQQTQLAMYNQNREDFQPYMQAGYSGLGAATGVEGLNGGQSSDPYANGALGSYLQAAVPYYGAAANYAGQIQPTAQGYLDRALTQDQYLGGVGDYVRTQGLPGPSGYPTWAEGPLNNFAGSPDYQFARNEAMRGMGQSLASTGQLASGGQIRGMGAQAAGLASQNFGNFRNSILSQWLPNVNALTGILQQGQGNALTEGKMAGSALSDAMSGMSGAGQAQLGQANALQGMYGNYFNNLMGIAGLGQKSTTSVAQLGANTAGNISNTQLAAGNAQANADLRSANYLSQGVQGAGAAFQPYFAQQSSPYNSNSVLNSDPNGFGSIDPGASMGTVGNSNPYNASSNPWGSSYG